MAQKLVGQTFCYENPPGIVSHGGVVGKEEGLGPLGSYFDLVYKDNKCGKDTWEKGEKQMVADAISTALEKGGVAIDDLDFIIGGDLLNQIITSSYTARDYSVPYLGIYGACSTMVEGMALGSLLLDGGYGDCILTFSSSHYQTAERQYRTPLEYGDQYPPYKQWTVTGAGAYILGWVGAEVVITHSTLGKVMDLGVKDANDLGSAMAPAAADTALQHFQDLNRSTFDYDLIATGDLGQVGLKVFLSLLQENGITKVDNIIDCGVELFNNPEKYGMGGSGCAASAVVTGSKLIPDLLEKNWQRILVIGTGALLSPLAVQQGESIPSIAHGIVIENNKAGEK